LLRGINKSFGSVQALRDVNLEVAAGQVTGLVGDNGAGKSTLIKAIAGIDPPDSGEFLWKGKPVHIHSPRDASELGIATVFQDLALCDNLDIVQNLYLGRELLSHRLRDETAMELGAKEALANLGIVTVSSVRQLVASLSGGQRQAVAVAKAAMINAELVILDEPTAALGVTQTEQVLELITRLAERGVGVIIISHNLRDIFQVADRIAVLYLGRLTAIGPAAEFDTHNTVEFITTGSGSSLASNGAIPTADGSQTTSRPEAPAPSKQSTTGVSANASGLHRGESVPVRVGGVPLAPRRASAAASTPPAPSPTSGLFAESFANYAQDWWKRIRSGQRGALPVLVGLVVIVVLFQFENSMFLSGDNLVNLMTQAASFVMFGMAEIFVLLLAEIDLSVGYAAGIGATVACMLAAYPNPQPWWICILAALATTTAIGFIQGTLVTRLRLPSFVVTLAGLLGWEGLMLALLDNSGAATGGTISITNNVLYDIVNGNLSPVGGWIVMIAFCVSFASFFWRRDQHRRRNQLSAPPVGLTAAKIAAAAMVGVVVVLLCNANRGRPGLPLVGMPWVVPILLALVMGYAFLLGRTRFGLYIYAVGGDAEAARRAGINLVRIRTAAFMFVGLTAGAGGIVYASRLGSISTSYDGGSLVLYAVAAAVIGGTSLFGGRGKMTAALLGGIIIAAIYNGMGLLGLGAAPQYMITALVLIAAVLIDALSHRSIGSGGSV
jgi:D-xylose transport system permease protein